MNVQEAIADFLQHGQAVRNLSDRTIRAYQSDLSQFHVHVDGAIRLLDLVVAEELRRKWIGRVMLNELAALAAKLEREWLVADVAHADFLRRVGFIEEGGVMKRRV